MNDTITTEEEEDTSINTDDLQIDYANDVINLHHTRQALEYENGLVLKDHDANCLACLGDKRVVGPSITSSSRPLCLVCEGTGRISKGQKNSE